MQRRHSLKKSTGLGAFNKQLVAELPITHGNGGGRFVRQSCCCCMRGLREVDLLGLPNRVLRRFILWVVLRLPPNALQNFKDKGTVTQPSERRLNSEPPLYA